MDDTTFLDALVRRGVLLSISVRYWRAQKKLNPEDLGLSRDHLDERLFSLGHKRLVPKDSLRRLKLLEGRAHALVEENTFPFLGGIARYLPDSKLEQVNARLLALKQEFEAEATAFVAGYGSLREQAMGEWQHAARALPGDPARLIATVREAFPPADVLPRSFGFDIRLFQIAVPDVPTAQLVELGDQMAVSRARREAALAARREIEHSCEEFVGTCVRELREQTAQLCAEMLETVNTTGSVHQKTLNRLVRFVERFGELNFANDAQMAAEREKARAELLTRSASEYRDSLRARGSLVTGLQKLRQRASELAREDATELVESFGQLGRRRFALCA
jgi:hypothetical protein